MYDTDTGRAVRESFKELAQHSRSFSESEEQRLRLRICAAVDELKSLGWPIERVIVRVKELAAEVGVRLGHTQQKLEDHPAVAKAVLWCVERYYDKDASPVP